MAEQFLRLPQVQQRIPLSRATIYARVKAGTFPAPVPIGPHAVAWLSSEIDAIIEATLAKAGRSRVQETGDVPGPRAIFETSASR